MARVTVEDCILKVPSRFELVVVAAQRARLIAAGSPLTVDRDNDKNPVVALREIANGTVDPEMLRDQVIKSFSTLVENDLHDEELAEIFSQETSHEQIYDKNEFKSLLDENEDSDQDDDTENDDKIDTPEEQDHSKQNSFEDKLVEDI